MTDFTAIVTAAIGVAPDAYAVTIAANALQEAEWALGKIIREATNALNSLILAADIAGTTDGLNALAAAMHIASNPGTSTLTSRSEAATTSLAIAQTAIRTARYAPRAS